MSHGHWMKIAVLLFTSTLPYLAKAQVGVEQPSETYWHLISDSGRPAVYLQYAGLTQDEISRVLPVLAEYDAKYQSLRRDYNKLSDDEQVNGAQLRFLQAKDRLAKEYDAKLTSLISPLSVATLQNRIDEVRRNTTGVSMSSDQPMQHKVVAASYHIHAQMNGPTCHPSFHYSSSWAIAFVLPDPSVQANGSITITSSVSGYTYVSGTACTTTHQGHATASLDTVSNEQYGNASATAHMSVSTNVTRNVAYDDPDNSTTTDPIYSTGINFTYAGTVHCPTFGYVLSVSNLNSPYRILTFRTKSQTGSYISSDAIASYFNESPFCLNVLIPIWDPSKLTVSPPNSIAPAFTWSENVGYQEYKGGPWYFPHPTSAIVWTAIFPFPGVCTNPSN